jgi:snapalysin
MSGSTGGVSCKNATPDASERASVEADYAGALASQSPLGGGIVVDAP